MARFRFLICLVMLSAIVGCGHGDVSPTTYEYAKALYSITNRKAGDSLDSVRSQIESDQADGKLTSSEAVMLNGIIDDAADGDWKSANRECRDVMEAQVKAQ